MIEESGENLFPALLFLVFFRHILLDWRSVYVQVIPVINKGYFEPCKATPIQPENKKELKMIRADPPLNIWCCLAGWIIHCFIQNDNKCYSKYTIIGIISRPNKKALISIYTWDFNQTCS